MRRDEGREKKKRPNEEAEGRTEGLELELEGEREVEDPALVGSVEQHQKRKVGREDASEEVGGTAGPSEW